MTFLVESVIACLAFTLIVFLMSRDPIKVVFNYPPVIIERCRSLGLVDDSNRPGGLNEKFANDYLMHATIIVHPKNEEIPGLVAAGEADVMITEITEAPWYVQNDASLAAPLLDRPFTNGEIGVLMRKGQEDLMELVNRVIADMKADGSLKALCDKYGLVYAY